MSLSVNIIVAVFVGATIFLMQQHGLVLPGWILSLTFLICLIYANIYLYRFPGLRFWTLRNFARMIVREFPNAGIKKISLSKYDSPYAVALGVTVPTKYHLIILLNTPLSAEGKNLQSKASNFHSPGGVNPRSIGLKNDFIEVYKNQPKGDYWEEWSFVVPDVSEKLNLKGHFGKRWVLYIKNFT